MAFSAENLRTMAKDDYDTTFWTYRTNDSIAEISRNDYWRGAVGIVTDGDIVLAISGHTQSAQAAQFLVAQTFTPKRFIVLAKFAETKS